MNSELQYTEAPVLQKLCALLSGIAIVKCRHQNTYSKHSYFISKNIRCRDFVANTIGTKWVGDLTYIKTAQGWLYLIIVMDLADRKIISWAMSETKEADQTTVASLRMAFSYRKIAMNSLLFHSDRGVQYACSAFRLLLETKQVNLSMSRNGNCWDNAVAASFFKSLKTEMVYQSMFVTTQQGELAVFEYIELWYNKKRLHSSLGNKIPNEMEHLFSNNLWAKY